MPMKYTPPKSEKPKLCAHRFYKIDQRCVRALVRNANAKRERGAKKMSESEIVRVAIRSLHAMTFHTVK
jgi:hypothetical protein